MTGGRRIGWFFRPWGTGAAAFDQPTVPARWAIIGRPCGASAPGKAPPRTPFETPEMPEWGWELVVQNTRNQCVMMFKKMITARVKEEIGGQGRERSPSPRPSPARERERLRPRGGNAGAPGWRGIVWGKPSGGNRQWATLVETLGSSTPQEWVGGLSLQDGSELRRGKEAPKSESGFGFVLQNADGELLMLLNCPGFSGGADPAPSGNPPCRIPARTGEDTVAGHRGILTLDLDLTLDLSGRTRTVKVSPAEWGCGFVPQHADGELLMSHDCPEIGGGENGSPAVRTGGRSAGVSFVPNGTGAGAVRSTHRWKRWANSDRPCGTSAPGKVPPRTHSPAAAWLRPAPNSKTPEYPESGLGSHAETTD